jgi:hypothetical protein
MVDPRVRILRGGDGFRAPVSPEIGGLRRKSKCPEIKGPLKIERAIVVLDFSYKWIVV